MYPGRSEDGFRNRCCTEGHGCWGFPDSSHLEAAAAVMIHHLGVGGWDPQDLRSRGGSTCAMSYINLYHFLKGTCLLKMQPEKNRWSCSLIYCKVKDCWTCVKICRNSLLLVSIENSSSFVRRWLCCLRKATSRAAKVAKCLTHQKHDVTTVMIWFPETGSLLRILRLIFK